MDQARILNVFDHIPIQLANVGIVNVCYALNFPELPLKGNYDETKFKLYGRHGSSYYRYA